MRGNNLIIVHMQDNYVKLDDFDNPLRGEVNLIDAIYIPDLLTNNFESKQALNLNHVELTDNNILQNFINPKPDTVSEFFSTDKFV